MSQNTKLTFEQDGPKFIARVEIGPGSQFATPADFAAEFKRVDDWIEAFLPNSYADLWVGHIWDIEARMVRLGEGGELITEIDPNERHLELVYQLWDEELRAAFKLTWM